MTTFDTIPQALLARLAVHQAKDEALAELADLMPALKAAQDVSRLARQLVHLVASNDPRLDAALDAEIGAAFGLSQSSASFIRRRHRGRADWEAARDGLIAEIEAGMDAVRSVLDNHKEKS